MKKTMVALTAAVSIFALSACNNGNDSEVLVETSAGNITKEDLYNELKEQAGSQILQEMVYEKILSDKYEATKEDIDAKYEEYKAALGAQFDMIVAQRGEEGVREILKSEVLRVKAAVAHMEVPDEVIKASHILISVAADATEEEVAEAEKLANDIKAKIDKGESFEELAKEHSADPSGANGGDLGYFGKGAMVEEFEKAAFGLKKDEVSAPVKTQYGFHIIKVTDVVKNIEEIDKEKQEEIKLSLVKSDQMAISNALTKEIEEAKIKVKDKDFEDLFKTESAE